MPLARTDPVRPMEADSIPRSCAAVGVTHVQGTRTQVRMHVPMRRGWSFSRGTDAIKLWTTRPVVKKSQDSCTHAKDTRVVRGHLSVYRLNNQVVIYLQRGRCNPMTLFKMTSREKKESSLYILKCS
ncbi:hypothetical protein CDAR_182411 [Caerostris darwini]|uniref:Uncharacterized protein n=1 Tax=Caerostris darwini TaxID=1538125 RepID=A0AAV4U5F1_9ARAC|nr:hypothetical protein CDAR_182411 [Caerostris darwini]